MTRSERKAPFTQLITNNSQFIPFLFWKHLALLRTFSRIIFQGMPSCNGVPRIREHLLPMLQLITPRIHEGPNDHFAQLNAFFLQHHYETQTTGVEKSSSDSEPKGLVEDQLRHISTTCDRLGPFAFHQTTTVVHFHSDKNGCK